jgi:hypothetical protein
VAPDILRTCGAEQEVEPHGQGRHDAEHDRELDRPLMPGRERQQQLALDRTELPLLGRRHCPCQQSQSVPNSTWQVETDSAADRTASETPHTSTNRPATAKVGTWILSSLETSLPTMVPGREVAAD